MDGSVLALASLLIAAVDAVAVESGLDMALGHAIDPADTQTLQDDNPVARHCYLAEGHSIAVPALGAWNNFAPEILVRQVDLIVLAGMEGGTAHVVVGARILHIVVDKALALDEVTLKIAEAERRTEEALAGLRLHISVIAVSSLWAVKDTTYTWPMDVPADVPHIGWHILLYVDSLERTSSKNPKCRCKTQMMFLICS